MSTTVSSPQRLLNNFLALAGTEFIGRTVRLGYLLVLVALLPQQDVGIYLYGIALYLSLAGLGAFGQGQVLPVQLGRRRNSAPKLIRHATALTVTATAICMLGGAAFILLARPTYRPELLLWFMPALLGRVATGTARSAFVGLECSGWVPRYEFAFRGIEALAGTVALVLGAGVATIMALHALTWIIEGIFAFRRLARYIGTAIFGPLDRRYLRYLVPRSALFAVGAWSFQLLPQLPLLLLPALGASAATLGAFGAMMQVLTTALIFPVTFGRASLPSFSRERARGKDRIVGPIAALRVGVFAGALLAIVAGPLAERALVLVFGGDYAKAGQLLGWVAWCLPAWSAVSVLIPALYAQGARLAGIGVSLSMASVLVVLGFAAAPVLGAEKATGAALIAGSALGWITGAVMLAKQTGVRPRALLLPAVAVSAPGALALVTAAAGLWLAALQLVTLVAISASVRTLPTAEVRSVLAVIRGRTPSGDSGTNQ